MAGGCGSAEESEELPAGLPHPGILFSSPQPSLGERHPPFRLPQEHRLFERLQDMVTKGKLSRRCNAGLLGPFPREITFSFLSRLCTPRSPLDPIQRSSSDPDLDRKSVV